MEKPKQLNIDENYFVTYNSFGTSKYIIINNANICKDIPAFMLQRLFLVILQLKRAVVAERRKI